MISACDIRYCTSDTIFAVKEVKVGMAADVGTLQRMPKIIGSESLMRELASVHSTLIFSLIHADSRA